MQGDFSRVTFDAARRFSAVLAQQGRVQLDADINEQTAILLHHLRTLAADLFGPAAFPAPADGSSAGGFAVSLGADNTLTVGAGRMYVDGILCECPTGGTDYWSQPDGHLDPTRDADKALPHGTSLVYLRVWERLVTAADVPAIREVALGALGPDTAVRTKVVWQLDWMPLTEEFFREGVIPVSFLREQITQRFGPRPRLEAKAQEPQTEDGTGALPPGPGYRGPENQLYRVEIHRGGTAGTATFKWSRENGSVVLPVLAVNGSVVEVGTLGRDSGLGVESGDMVELVDDAVTCRTADDADPGDATAPDRNRLYRVADVDHAARHVYLDAYPAGDQEGQGAGTDPALHPVLRRWDHRPPEQQPADTADQEDQAKNAQDSAGAVPVAEGTWLPLEDGIAVRFSAGEDHAKPRRYRSGDYWLIPARVVTGDVEWPTDPQGNPVPGEPHGVDYHYAPLAVVKPVDKDTLEVKDMRTPFPQPRPPRPDQA
ncbi:DUF6519 domain-containing protein [Streptomyces klenkii]|uniref:DUF6519 domain-containing protein n=1 Tax=Streptomyces klenkii TaxID=1420899 RepID=UPI0036EFE0EF